MFTTFLYFAKVVAITAAMAGAAAAGVWYGAGQDAESTEMADRQ